MQACVFELHLRLRLGFSRDAKDLWRALDKDPCHLTSVHIVSQDLRNGTGRMNPELLRWMSWTRWPAT